jgi:signal transduction histidine kinase
VKLVTPFRAAVVLAAIVAFTAIVSLTFPKGAALAAYGNCVQAALLLMAVVAFIRNARRAGGNQRLFWWLYAIGTCLWLVNQSVWIYHENIKGAAVPDPYWGDVVLFIHVVPWIAAVSLQPHATVSAADLRLRFGRLDFMLLGLWWIFLYGYVVLPYQYVSYNSSLFSKHFNTLYSIENFTLIGTLAVFAFRTRKGWSRIYGHLGIAAALYSLSSVAINLLIASKDYYTGSVYDVPLVAAMAWLVYAGVRGSANDMDAEPVLISFQKQAYVHSIMAALAVLSMPVLAVWAGYSWDQDPVVQRFRVLITLGSMLLLMMLLFLKQNLLDRKLVHLLQESRDSYESLQALQDNLVQAEKLASIGRLVAGAAHEINNPLTAIVGYSDLLSAENSLDPQHRDLAAKILQQARRTKALVNNLLTFAKQTPVRLAPVDVNAISDKALQLHSFELTRHNIAVTRHMEFNLPAIAGDENQLLQVCMHIVGNAIDALAEVKDRERSISISTRLQDGVVEWTCSDNGPGVANPKQIFDPFFTTKPVGKGTGLGLSTSYGIIREHNGTIECRNVRGGGAEFTFTIPINRLTIPGEPIPQSPTLKM